MANQASLEYRITAKGPTSVAKLATASNATLLPTGDLTPFGVTLASDTQVIVGTEVRRTILFNLDALFNTLFPIGTDQACMFRELFTQILSGSLKAVVVAQPVVLI